MDIIQAILRIVVVSVISFALSITAMLVIKWMNFDIKDFKQRNHPYFLMIAGAFNILFIVAVALILKYWDRQSLGKLGFSFGGMNVLFSLFILIVSVGLALLFVWYLHYRHTITLTWTKDYFNTLENPLNTLLAFLVLFIAALQEEIMFRGYFGYVLLPFGFFQALLISSLIFTIWHFITNKVNLFQTVDWFLGGIMLFYIYWLSGSIWVASLVHFSRNFTNVLVFNIAGANAVVSYKKPITPDKKTIYTILYSIVVILFGLIFYH